MSAICALEDEVDSVLKLEEYAFPVSRSVWCGFAVGEEKTPASTVPIAAWAAGKSCKFRGVKTFRKSSTLKVHHLFSFNLWHFVTFVSRIVPVSNHNESLFSLASSRSCVDCMRTAGRSRGCTETAHFQYHHLNHLFSSFCPPALNYFKAWLKVFTIEFLIAKKMKILSSEKLAWMLDWDNEPAILMRANSQMTMNILTRMIATEWRKPWLCVITCWRHW